MPDQAYRTIIGLEVHVQLMTKTLNQELVAAGGFKDMRKTMANAAELSANASRLSVQLNAIAAEQNRNLTLTMASFRREYQMVDLEVRESTTEKLLEGLREGHLDVAIVALPIKQPEIVCSELFREPLLVAVPENHPLSDAKGLAVPQLLGERMLLLREGHCLRDDVLTICSRAKVQFQQVFESDHLASIFALVANGFGVSIVPGYAGADARGCKLLRLEPKGVRRIGYAQVRGHHVLPVQRRFIEFLKKWRWAEG